VGRESEDWGPASTRGCPSRVERNEERRRRANS